MTPVTIPGSTTAVPHWGTIPVGGTPAHMDCWDIPATCEPCVLTSCGIHHRCSRWLVDHRWDLLVPLAPTCLTRASSGDSTGERPGRSKRATVSTTAAAPPPTSVELWCFPPCPSSRLPTTGGSRNPSDIRATTGVCVDRHSRKS